ncbi:MAG: response regulator transcription factor [Dehalococcoidia bacterium]|nr:response regulator transcription factor [Dehalococcoidia bacterium]
MMREIRILLVDDCEIARKGLWHMLKLEDDMDVVGDCASAEEAFSLVDTLSPAIILMDVGMPGIDGIEATRRLKKNGFSCNAEVIMLAESMDHLVRAMEAGAVGYLPKDVKQEGLAQAIRQVYENEYQSKRYGGLVEEVELLVPSPVDSVQLLGFAGRLEDALGGTIMQTIGSWETGAAITILVKPTPVQDILKRLRSMPDVESVEDELLAKGTWGFLKKFRALQWLRGKPSKSIMVTLKQAGVPEQELASVSS